MRVAVVFEPAFEQVAGEARVALVEVDGDEVELHRGALLQQAQQVQQGVRVFAARDGDHDAVTLFDEPEVVHGLADVLQERFLQSVEVVHA